VEAKECTDRQSRCSETCGKEADVTVRPVGRSGSHRGSHRRRCYDPSSTRIQETIWIRL